MERDEKWIRVMLHDRTPILLKGTWFGTDTGDTSARIMSGDSCVGLFSLRDVEAIVDEKVYQEGLKKLAEIACEPDCCDHAQPEEESSS